MLKCPGRRSSLATNSISLAPKPVTTDNLSHVNWIISVYPVCLQSVFKPPPASQPTNQHVRRGPFIQFWTHLYFTPMYIFQWTWTTLHSFIHSSVRSVTFGGVDWWIAPLGCDTFCDAPTLSPPAQPPKNGPPKMFRNLCDIQQLEYKSDVTWARTETMGCPYFPSHRRPSRQID